MNAQPVKAAAWRRTLPSILSAALSLACVTSSSTTRAADISDGRRSTSAPAGINSGADGAAPAMDARIKSNRTGNLQPHRTGAQAGGGSTGQNSAAQVPRARETPQRGIRQGAVGSADHVHPRMPPPAHLARRATDPNGSNRSARGDPARRLPGKLGAASEPSAAPKRTALPVANVKPSPGMSAIGGPRIQSGGPLGGMRADRRNHDAVIDGARFHPRF
jgi:hypothetical protein